MKLEANNEAKRKIVIFCTKHNFQTVKYQIEEIRDGYNIVLQTPDREVFAQLSELNGDVKISNDCDLITRSMSKFIKTLESKKRGWYLQQYLKLKTIENEEDSYLILDGDTFLRREVIDEIFREKYILRVKEKYQDYNRLIYQLFPGIHLLKHSTVSNCVLVEPKCINEYIPSIDDFFQRAMKLISENNQLRNVDFSEYQIINTIQNKQSKKIRDLSLFRRADLLDEQQASQIRCSPKSRYDGYAIEKNHKNDPLRKILARIIYLIGIRKW